ncbi:DUF4062 domain-containing protein [Nocardia takedensis]|uniref:DUF4062 domain-containing protein n=1 Tax=Nocardia takedensis TaxID=259390 RepID=UPI0002E4AD40|nr:DUF4062 domain-containing protein [Nocardia takedensis]
MPVIPIFLSSTFRDFHGERDVLVEHVRPVLDDAVAPFGCRVDLIDLRWGAGDDSLDEEARLSRVLDVCFAEIDRARPLFVGLIGQRYGWIPGSRRVGRIAAAIGLTAPHADCSATELEFVYGAFDRPETEAVFFAREIIGETPPGWVDADPAPMARLRGLAERHGRVSTYRVAADGGKVVDLADFEALAIRVLSELVVRRAELMRDTAVDAANAAEQLFFQDRTRAFDGRAELVNSITAILDSARGVCLLGESGVGKSAVWCAVVERLRGSGVRVAALLLDTSTAVRTEAGIISRSALDLGIELDTGISHEQLQQRWRGGLARIGPCVLAIDGLDTLPENEGREHLRFLHDLPANVTVLVSTTESGHAAALSRSGIDTIPVEPLAAGNARAAVDAVCRSLGRNLPQAAVAELTATPRTALWLRLAIGELLALDEEDYRVLNDSSDPLADLTRLLLRAVTAMPPTSEAIIGRIADRVEQRFGPAATGDVVQILVTSRSGLAPIDLEAITGVDQLAVAGIRRGLQGMVTVSESDGRSSFAHSLVRHTLHRRYPSAESGRSLHARIARHLAATPNSDPIAGDDLLWHLFRAEGDPPAGPMLNKLAYDTPAGRRAGWIVIDAAGQRAFRSTLSGIGPSGMEYLNWVAGEHKHLMTQEARRTLSTHQFEVAVDLLQQAPAEPAGRHRVASALERLADLGRTPNVPADAELAAARRGVEVARSLAPEGDTDPTVGRAMAAAQTRLGRAAETIGDADLAREAFTEAVTIWRGLVDDPRAGEIARSWLQWGLRELAATAAAAGDRACAHELLLESLEHARWSTQFDTPAMDSNVSDALTALGAAEVALGDYSAARGTADEALALARKLVALEPGPQWKARLAQALRLVAQIETDTGRPEAAEPAYLEEATAWQQASDADPLRIDIRLMQVQAVRGAARAAAAQQKLPEAMQYFAEAARLSDLALSIAPEDTAAREYTADTYREAGRFHKTAGDFGMATTLLTKAAEQLRLSLGANPDDASAEVLALAAIVAELAESAVRLGNFDYARQLLGGYLSYARAQLAAAPDDFHLRQAVLVLGGEAGDTAWASGDFAGAVDARDEALKVARTMLAADPSSSAAQRNASALAKGLGEAAQRLGLWRRARDAYSEAHRLLAGMREGAEPESWLQLELAIVTKGIGITSLYLEDPAVALDGFGDSRRHALAALGDGELDDRTVSLLWSAALGSAEAALMSGDRRHARAALDEAVQLDRTPYAVKSLDSADYHTLATLLIRLGDIEIRARKFSAAGTAYGEAPEALETTLRRTGPGYDPASVVAAAHNGIAYSAYLQGDYRAARSSFEKAVTIRRTLLAAHPGSLPALKSLQQSLVGLAEAAAELGERRVAERAQRELRDLQR